MPTSYVEAEQERRVNAVRTPVCELLGIDQPIVLAPMVSIPELAAAVSMPAPLGMLTLTWSDHVGAVVRETAELTPKPFCGNLVLTDDRHHRLDQALDAGLRVVSFFMGRSDRLRSARACCCRIVLHTVGTAEEARAAAASGVDVIVAQGWEAGGHVWGNIATLPLVPAVVDAVAPVPVIAACGIGDARGVAAVLALGAQAAWVGTRFLLAEEMPIHEEYRRCSIAAAETDSQRYPNLYSVGWPDSPHRALRNSTADTWEAAGRPPACAAAGRGRRDRALRVGRGHHPLRARPADGRDHRRHRGDLDVGGAERRAGEENSSLAAEIVAELTSARFPGRPVTLAARRHRRVVDDRSYTSCMGRTSDAREKILSAAQSLIELRGYSALGVAEICKAADVPKGSFYYFFESKEALALAVIDEHWAEPASAPGRAS